MRPKDLEARIRAYVIDQGGSLLEITEGIDDDDPEKWGKRDGVIANEAENLGQMAVVDEEILPIILPEIFRRANNTPSFLAEVSRGTPRIIARCGRDCTPR